MTAHNTDLLAVAAAGLLVAIGVFGFGVHPGGFLPIGTAAVMLLWQRRSCA